MGIILLIKIALILLTFKNAIMAITAIAVIKDNHHDRTTCTIGIIFAVIELIGLFFHGYLLWLLK